MVTNHITDHKARLILGSDPKAAPFTHWGCPKAAIAVFGKGGVEEGRTRFCLHKHLLPQNPTPYRLRNTTIKEFHVGKSKEKTADWDPSPCTQGCIRFSDSSILLLATKLPLLQCGRFCIGLRDCCCLLLSSQPWQVWLSSAVLCLAPLQLAGLLFQRGFSLGPWPCTTACTFQALL